MRRWFRRHAKVAVVLAAVLPVTGAGVVAWAGETSPPVVAAGTSVVALIGDSPYSTTQQGQYPALVSAINGASGVVRVFHVGDTKASGACSDAYFTGVRDSFNTFSDPVFFTPGDNDWADCHRSDNGQFVPTERLDAIRRIFYPTPGKTLGQTPLDVSYQQGYVENTRTRIQGVIVATFHMIGSANGLNPWTGLPGGDQPAARQAEYNGRMTANLTWIDEAFLRAKNENAPGVLLVTQAEPTTASGFLEIRNKIKAKAAEFGKPVLIVHGDEHKFEYDATYAGLANLSRLEVCGNQVPEWVSLTIDTADPGVFSWQRHSPQTGICPGATTG
ncbi:hypothetical protein AB0I28_13260 [Phytomonospora sp. NPDC050363]|uniref:hypothetical protein n=1 Tax=Phytomonospora sp. NPDC050363 TaxID=3155642 RepID=UPI0033D8F77C